VPRVHFDTKSIPVIDESGESATLLISTPIVFCGPPGTPEVRRDPTFSINGATAVKLSETEFETIVGRRWRVEKAS